MYKKSISLIAIGLTICTGLVAQNTKTMKTINNNAPVTCTKTITINASPKKVWETLTTIANWNTWQSAVSESKLNGELKPNTEFDWKAGGTKIHSRLHTVEPYSEFGWTGKAYTIYAIHNWTLKETSGATEVIVSESMEGFLAKLFKKSLYKTVEKGMMTSLEDLKKASE